MKLFRSSFLWLLVVTALVATFQLVLFNIVSRNYFSIQLISAIERSPEHLSFFEQQVHDVPYPACYSNWIYGVIAARLGQTAQSQMKWASFLQCSPQAVNQVQRMAPDDQLLASLAVKLYPDNIDALYWLAGLMENDKDDQSSIALYQQIVHLIPDSALAWCRIGHFQESKGQIQSALSAYLNCCSNGDPGVNGCWGAGRMAEKLGNPSQAISYYRLSKWPPALQRADQLEQQLQQP